MSQLSEYDAFSAIFGRDSGFQSILLSSSSSSFLPHNPTNRFFGISEVRGQLKQSKTENDRTRSLPNTKIIKSNGDGRCVLFIFDDDDELISCVMDRRFSCF
mmetsp:Transcript_13295/g.27526  ORF Transcript_13295/g.27526 Transcript_13295/m.27526 type:complete len:102 (+) Transcript_13295:922-1227(+)